LYLEPRGVKIWSVTSVQSGRTYRGADPAQRRDDRRTRLVDAAVEIFGTTGYRSATVERICAAAGLTKRYFYESFDSSEALLLAAYTHAIDTLHTSMLTGAATAYETAVRPDASGRAEPASAAPTAPGQTDGQTCGQADGQTDGQADGRACGQANGQPDGYADGRQDGQTDGRLSAAALDAMVRGALDALFGTIDADPRLARIAFFEILGVSAAVDDAYRAAIERFAGTVRMLAEPAFRDSDLSDDDRDAIADGVIGAVLMIAQHWVVNDRRRPLDAVVRTAHTIVTAVLDRLTTDQH
jgi:AcrR family transcriptional regulator